MIEEVVSDVECPYEMAGIGPEDDEELVLISVELEEHSYSKVKLKLFEQRRTRHAQDPEPELPQEQLHGWRVVSYLMSTNCRSFSGPFLDKPETSMRDHWRNYGDGLRDTTWLGKIKQQIQQKKTYESLSQIVSDLRLMLEKCYLTFGPHHPISKKGIKLEQVLEQKVNTWPISLREKCSIDATRNSGIPRSRLKVEDGESMLIAIIRHEKSVKEREQRFKAREGKKFEKETLTLQAEHWEKAEVLQKVSEVQGFWEVPHVAHFLFLAQHALGFPEFTMYEFERSLLYPKSSLLLHSLMTCLLTTGFKSVNSTANKPPIAYKEWNDKLRNKLSGWYKTLVNHGMAKVFEDAGIEDTFFVAVGDNNPFNEVNEAGEWSTFEDFPVRSRVAIIKGLCDQRLAKHRTVQDYFVENTYPGDEMREVRLGVDLSEREYFYFPCLSNHDVRIYSRRQLPTKPHDDCYQVAIKRVPRTPKPKKRKKKQHKEQLETKSRRRSAKQAAQTLIELSSSESEEEFDEEVVVYNSDGCPIINPGEQQHDLDFALAADSVKSLKFLIDRLTKEAEVNDKENGQNGCDKDEGDETTNDTQENNDDKAEQSKSSNEEDEEEAKSESDFRSLLAADEESSQDANQFQPRRSSRAHRQTQRFSEADSAAEDDGKSSNSHVATRRCSRRLQENGEAKVEPLIIKKVPEHRERLTMKIVLNKPKCDRKQPSNKVLISQLEAILKQFLPYEQGFAQNDQRTRLKLYTEVHHPNLLQEEQKQKAEEDKSRRSKRVKDPWSTSSQYMDNEILYGDSAFDCLSDSDEETAAKKAQPTRRSTRNANSPEQETEDDREWKYRDGERF